MLTNLNKGPVLTKAAGPVQGVASGSSGAVLPCTLSDPGVAVLSLFYRRGGWHVRGCC